MITHKTYKTSNNEWVMPKEVLINNGKLIREKTKESLIEGPWKKCQNQKKML